MSEYDDRKSKKKSQKIRPQNSIDKNKTTYEEDGWDLYELHNILGNKGMLNWLAQQEESETQINMDAEHKLTIGDEEHTLVVEWQDNQFVVMRYSVPTDFIRELESLVGVIDSDGAEVTPANSGKIREKLLNSIHTLNAANFASSWLYRRNEDAEEQIANYETCYPDFILQELMELLELRTTRSSSRSRSRELSKELVDNLSAFIDHQFAIIDELYDDNEDYFDELYKLIPGRFRKAEEVPYPAGFNGHIATGEAGDPIPIKWYKKPIDYEEIILDDATIDYTDRYELNYDETSYVLGLSPDNLIMPGDYIRKVRSSQERGNQQNFNKALKEEGYDLSKKNKDGDHVKDLGFDGEDVDDNYWPLDSTKNRYAFFSYNPHYEVLYKKEDKIMKAPIGSLIGKWFIVIDYLEQGEALGNDAYTAWLTTIQ